MFKQGLTVIEIDTRDIAMLESYLLHRRRFCVEFFFMIGCLD